MTRTTDCCSCFRPERMYRTIANMIFTSVFEEEELRHQFAVLALNKTNLLNLDLPSPDKITELEKALEDCEEEYIKLVTLLQINQITPGDFTVRNTEIQEKKTRIEKRLKDSKNKQLIQESAIDQLEAEGICEDLKSISERFKQIDIDNRILYRYVERIIVHKGSLDWYLCCNNNPYLYYRQRYKEERFDMLSRKKIYTGTLTKPDVYRHYHPDPDEPDYRWKDIEVNIWV